MGSNPQMRTLFIGPAPYQQWQLPRYPLGPNRSGPPAPRTPRLPNLRIAQPQGVPSSDHPPVRGAINMIFGGATNMDSNRSRKRHSWEECLVVTAPNDWTRLILGFGPSDLEGVATPHSDALAIQVLIANFNVGRVFVDPGSSVDILYWSVLEKMG